MGVPYRYGTTFVINAAGVHVLPIKVAPRGILRQIVCCEIYGDAADFTLDLYNTEVDSQVSEVVRAPFRICNRLVYAGSVLDAKTGAYGASNFNMKAPYALADYADSGHVVSRDMFLVLTVGSGGERAYTLTLTIETPTLI